MKHWFVIALMVPLSMHTAVAADAGTLDRIRDSGEIRIGFREANPPMSFLDDKGRPAGYSVDLCREIASEVKRELGDPNIAVKYVAVTAENRFQSLSGDAIDILCGATTKTLSRAKLVGFTQLTFVTGATLMSLRENPVAEVGELQGKKVAVVPGTTTIAALKTALKDADSDAEVVPVDSSIDGLKALVDGRVQAYSSDQVVLVGLMIGLGERDKFVISREMFSLEPFALAVRREDTDFRLMADRVLSRLYRSAEINGIYDRWFGAFAEKMPRMVEALYILNSTPE